MQSVWGVKSIHGLYDLGETSTVTVGLVFDGVVRNFVATSAKGMITAIFAAISQAAGIADHETILHEYQVISVSNNDGTNARVSVELRQEVEGGQSIVARGRHECHDTLEAGAKAFLEALCCFVEARATASQ